MTTLVVLTLPVQRNFGSPLRPEISTAGPWETTWQQTVEAGWWVTTTDEVVNMIVYACSEQASATSGAALRVDRGIVRFVA